MHNFYSILYNSYNKRRINFDRNKNGSIFSYITLYNSNIRYTINIRKKL